MNPDFQTLYNEAGDVLLRPIGWRDIPNFWRILGDPEILDGFQNIPVPRNALERAAGAVMGTKYYRQLPFHWIIINRRHESIGCLTFRDDGLPDEMAVSGLALLAAYRGTREIPQTVRPAFQAAVKHICQRRPNLKSLTAITKRNNEKSRRWMEKGGFVETPESAAGQVMPPSSWLRTKDVPIFKARLDLAPFKARFG